MTEPTTPSTSLTQEERATLIKILFEALQVPPWTKDDLIGLGKIVFTKIDIKDFAKKDANLFARLLPHFAKIVNFFWTKIVLASFGTPNTPNSIMPPTPSNAPPTTSNTPPTPANTSPTSANTPPTPENTPPAPANISPTPTPREHT